MAPASIVLYIVSMMMPPFAFSYFSDLSIAFGDVTIGLVVAYLGAVGTWPLLNGVTAPLAVACGLGTAANLIYVVCYPMCLGSKRRQMVFYPACAGALLAVLSMVALAASGEIASVLPGFAFWLGSFVALAWGTWRNRDAALQANLKLE